MDRIYGRLDEAKAEIEKLKAHLKCKVEFSDNFKCFRRLTFRKWEIRLLWKKCKISEEFTAGAQKLLCKS